MSPTCSTFLTTHSPAGLSCGHRSAVWFADKKSFHASTYLMASCMDLLLEFRGLPYNSTYSPPHETNDVLVSQVVPRSRSDAAACEAPVPSPSPTAPPVTYWLSFGSRGSRWSLHKHKEISQLFSLSQDPDDICSGALGKLSAVCLAHRGGCEEPSGALISAGMRGWRAEDGGSGPVLRVRWLPGHSCSWFAFLSSGF